MGTHHLAPIVWWLAEGDPPGGFPSKMAGHDRAAPAVPSRRVRDADDDSRVRELFARHGGLRTIDVMAILSLSGPRATGALERIGAKPVRIPGSRQKTWWL